MKRATVFQNMQIGVEGIAGTPVAATAKLIETYIAPRPVAAIEAYRPQGSQFPVDVVRGKEYTEADIEGALSYTEIPYLLASLLTNAGGLTYKPPAWAAPAVDTLTVEVGSTGRAERFAYGVVTGLRFRFTKAEAAVTGKMIGRKLTEGHAITAGLSPVTKRVVNPDKVDVLIGASVAGLAQVDEFLEVEFGIQNRFSPLFTLDSAQDSFSDLTPRAPDLSAQLILPHEATAAGYMADLRASTQRFCRVVAAETIGGVACSFQLTFPFHFRENARGDQDDVYASTFTLQPIHDNSFAAALEIVVVNS